jgi:hypothetical protein
LNREQYMSSLPPLSVLQENDDVRLAHQYRLLKPLGLVFSGPFLNQFWCTCSKILRESGRPF